MVSPWANGSIEREEWATRSHLQLSEPGGSGDLRFELLMVKEIPYIWKKIPMKANDMDFQPMKDIQDITTTYTRDIALETRQFSEFPTSELEGWWVFWSWNGWVNELMTIIVLLPFTHPGAGDVA